MEDKETPLVRRPNGKRWLMVEDEAATARFSAAAKLILEARPGVDGRTVVELPDGVEPADFEDALASFKDLFDGRSKSNTPKDLLDEIDRFFRPPDRRRRRSNVDQVREISKLIRLAPGWRRPSGRQGRLTISNRRIRNFRNEQAEAELAEA